MSESKFKQYSREKFLIEHPFCCYCGERATTTDHCPPRALFRQRQWPEGYEFPACDKCNKEGRRNEAIISVLYRTMITNEELDPDTKKQMDGLKKNRPDIIQEWLQEWEIAGRNWLRRKLRERFGDAGDEMRRRGYGVINLGSKTHEATHYFGEKLAKALYYKIMGRRHMGVLFSKSIYIFQEDFIKSLLEIAPAVPSLKRGPKELSDQFIYRYNYNPDLGVLYAVVGFKEQLGYVIFAFEQGFYDSMIKETPCLAESLQEMFYAQMLK